MMTQDRPGTAKGVLGDNISALGYVATTVLSAFLLFEVEPLIAKLILPWFGGGASVWSVCLLFFQAMLLLGYLYAHLLTSRCKPSLQVIVHATLVLLSLCALPLVLPKALKPTGLEEPALRILLVLGAAVGLPYFTLSSSSPLLQFWFAEAKPCSAPYKLYAFSNIGSLVALLSYPLLLEPFVSSHHQTLGWSGAYVCFVAFSAVLAWLHGRGPSTRGIRGASIYLPWRHKALWVGLAACGSTVLLATTSYVSQNIAAVPLLWTIPLSLYLITFILCFESRSRYNRAFCLRFFAVGLAAMAYMLGRSQHPYPTWVVIATFFAGLFGCCMVCHGELAALAPASPDLTAFYLHVALGGAIGAFFVAIVAPSVFSGYYELPIGLGCCGLLIHVVNRQNSSAASPWNRTRTGRVIAWVMVVSLCASLYVSTSRQATRFRSSARNFFGVLRTEDFPGPPVVLLQDGIGVTIPGGPGYRELINGTIEHGIQFLSPSRRREATTYYGPKSGVAIALKTVEAKGPVRVGVIGLGAGTLAVYGRPRDEYTFFEINPLVISTARTQFTCLQDTPAKVTIIQDDARLALERDRSAAFDLIVVDAFSGDSVPTHLLTREAFAIYVHHLSSTGLLAVHVSNRYLNLAPVVLAAAQSLGLEAQIIESKRDTGHAVYPATWVVLGRPKDQLRQSRFEELALLPTKADAHHLWTDDYSSIFRAFRW